MYRTINWKPIIEEVAGPMVAGDNHKSWLARAARKSGVSFRQICALWYGEIKDPKTSISIGVLCAAEKARAEASALASQYEALAGGLNAKDADLYGSDVLALVNAARALRGQHRP